MDERTSRRNRLATGSLTSFLKGLHKIQTAETPSIAAASGRSVARITLRMRLAIACARLELECKLLTVRIRGFDYLANVIIAVVFKDRIERSTGQTLSASVIA